MYQIPLLLSSCADHDLDIACMSENGEIILRLVNSATMVRVA